MSAVPPPATPDHRYGARVLEWSTRNDIARELERTGSGPETIDLIARRGRIFPVRLHTVPLRAAPILKREVLSVGGEVAHARSVADRSAESSPFVLVATWEQYRRLLPKLRRQPFHLNDVSDEIDRALRGYTSHGPQTVPGAHRSFSVGGRPRVMGVVNVTPDSFSDGGRFLDPVAALGQAERLVAEGADFIDIGGESTRPGATPVTPEAEWGRIAPVLAAVHDRLAVPVSVDTRHPEVAAKAVDAGADLINDVEGLRSEAMRRVVERSGAAVIVLHMRGTPETMQDDLEYGDVRSEVYAALAAATTDALRAGIPAEKILIDPGLGFGKSAEQNLDLLAHAGEFRSLGFPVVVGASRKSFLGVVLGTAGPLERLEAGLAAAVIAAERGVAIVRTHDVAPTVRALTLVEAVRRRSEQPPTTSEALAATGPDD